MSDRTYEVPETVPAPAAPAKTLKKARKKYPPSPAAAAHKRAYDDEYKRRNTRTVTMMLVRTTDADILQELETSGNIQGRAKELIRKGMAAERRRKT